MEYRGDVEALLPGTRQGHPETRNTGRKYNVGFVEKRANISERLIVF